MSRILSIALIALYALTLSQAYIPHVNYWMNHDYIAANLCENKDQPELHCDGKCQLQKEIKSSTEDQQEGQEVSLRLMVEFLQPLSTIQVGYFIINQKHDFPFCSAQIVPGYLSSIFHPPRV